MNTKTSAAAPFLVPLDHVEGMDVGGKALSLGRLARIGLSVPRGFVIVHAAAGLLPDGLTDALSQLGGAVAVRSSATDEDGALTSFAGQHDTSLGVEGIEAVRDAVERCLASARGVRASTYREEMGAPAEARMSVIVQCMVDARASGVLFTADPVTGARDRVIVDATSGIGEALVSGLAAADHAVLSRDGRVVSRVTPGAPVVAEALLAQLVSEALLAEARFGHPLDMEWAVGADGVIQWLQARPITTLDLPGRDEFDSTIDPEGRTFTTFNVGEVLPGAITPLGWSVFGESSLAGMRSLFARYGVPLDELAREPPIVQFGGHVFLNMNAMYLTGRHVLGMSKEDADISVAGHVLSEVAMAPAASLPARIANAARYFGTLLQARRRLERFQRAHARFDVARASDPVALHRNLGEALGVVSEAVDVQVHVSSLSGTLHGVLLAALSSGRRPPLPEHHALAAELLAFVEPGDGDAGDSSLGLAAALDRLASTLAADQAEAARFAALPVDAALAYLREGGPAAVRAAFAELLRGHGHRSPCEAEIRQPSWQEDPRSLVAGLQIGAASPPAANRRAPTPALSTRPRSQRLVVGWIVERARAAIVLRERAKSLSVRILRRLRGGYLDLARMLVERGRLTDTDLVFFLTHDELGRVARASDPSLVRRALHRRRLHPQKVALTFPRVSRGRPIPADPRADRAPTDDVLRGTPVSRGVAVGRARVAKTPAEAAKIEPGEILIVSSTDVGWAPYFVRAAGLATEIGSALSHGAVVAREYGLPAVTGVADATRILRDGDLVRLDGDTGELVRLA